MRLPKRLSDAVMFARWCAREQQEPAAVARLLVLARRAKRAGEQYCNGVAEDQSHYTQRMEEFAVAAEEMGYTTDWPGLWPALRLPRSGQDVYLPDV